MTINKYELINFEQKNITHLEEKSKTLTGGALASCKKMIAISNRHIDLLQKFDGLFISEAQDRSFWDTIIREFAA